MWLNFKTVIGWAWGRVEIKAEGKTSDQFPRHVVLLQGEKCILCHYRQGERWGLHNTQRCYYREELSVLKSPWRATHDGTRTPTLSPLALIFSSQHLAPPDTADTCLLTVPLPPRLEFCLGSQLCPQGLE